MGSFKSPVERLDQRLNVPVHGRCGERRSPKVQPSTRPGIEPGTSWLAVRDLTNCANLAHTIQWLISGGIHPGAYIRGLTSGGLYPGTYIRGTYIRGLYPGLISGVIYPGTYIQWPIYSRNLYLGLIQGAHIQWLISRGLYPRASNQRLISGAYIRQAYIRGQLGAYIREYTSWSLYPGAYSRAAYIQGAYIPH